MIRRLTRCVKCPSSLKKQILESPKQSTFEKPHNFDCVRPNLTFARKFHLTAKSRDKIYVDSENTFAYKTLPLLRTIEPGRSPQDKVTVQNFNKFLEQNWRASNATSIVAAFEKVKEVCISNNITLSDPRFDKLVDGLMDHCEKLTDEELLQLLLTLTEYPPCAASYSHNFHDVWSCLDDICCWKMASWEFPTMYAYADVWYKWNLGRLSDYVFEVLDKATSKPQRLSKNMLLYTQFYINVNRRKTVPFEFEHALAQRIGEFSVDELAIIAMGYFKSRSKIKLKAILSAMIQAISDNYETIHEISLAAMLKGIRFSQHVEVVDEIAPMLEKISGQISRLSTMSLVHVALIGTSLQLKHEASLLKCTERVVQDLEKVRLKDIERMLLACSMFNLDTNPSFFEKALKELQKESRRKEFVSYNRCLPSTLHYLSLRQIYSYPLMNEVLDEDYINETFGKSSKNLPRELFSLDTSIDIECPNYKGNRISRLKKYKSAKWLSEWAPSPHQSKRLSLSDKFYLDVASSLKDAVGAERLLRHDHVLPHFSKSDIILCRDRASGDFVEPFGFEDYVLGDVKKPFNLDKYEWVAVVVMTPNLTVRDRSEPLGGMLMKKRQLKAVGYTPILVYWNEFGALDPFEKGAFLRRQLCL